MLAIPEYTDIEEVCDLLHRGDVRLIYFRSEDRWGLVNPSGGPFDITRDSTVHPMVAMRLIQQGLVIDPAGERRTKYDNPIYHIADGILPP